MSVSARTHRGWRWSGILAAAAALTVIACQDGKVPTGEREFSKGRLAAGGVRSQSFPVAVEVFAPEAGDQVGDGAGMGWFVDLAIVFPGGSSLASTGFTGNQLTGAGVHANAPPFPGSFGIGKDDHFGGLIVLLSSNTEGGGSCQNLADLFNLTGPTNITDEETEIWDTWIIGAPYAGVNTRSTLWVAEARDLDGDGIWNDAPDVVADANGDGRCSEPDLKAVGLASEVAEVHFFIR